MSGGPTSVTRRAFLLGAGTTEAVHAGEQEVARAIRALAGGEGVDETSELAAKPPAALRATKAVSRRIAALDLFADMQHQDEMAEQALNDPDNIARAATYFGGAQGGNMLLAHIPATWPLARTAMVPAVTHHHRVHRDPRLVSRWKFNFALPLFDVLFGSRARAPGDVTSPEEVP